MNSIVINVLFIFLGSVLTFVSTWLVEFWKDKQERKEKEKNFVLYVRQEFLVISKGLEKLKTVQEFRRYFEYRTLDRLDKSIANVSVQEFPKNCHSECSEESLLRMVSFGTASG